MKIIPLNLRFVIILVLLLFVIVLVQSLFEYRSSHKAVHDLLNNQARALIMSVGKASEKGLLAYEIQQKKINEHLFTIAEMVDRLESASNLSNASLDDIASSNRLVLIEIMNESNSLIYSNTRSGGQSMLSDKTVIDPVLTGETSKLALEFTRLSNGKNTYAAAIKRTRGGIIIVGIDTSELLAMRRTFGAGSVIEDISQSPGVEYAGILQNGVLLAASRNFPRDLSDSWYNANIVNADSIITRIHKSKTDSVAVFEATGKFAIGDDNYGNIVIGINTGYLEFLTGKLKRDIIWRSGLFLMAAIIVILVVTLRQNYRLLTGKYTEIQKEVQSLEADKALSAKLVAMGELAGGVAHEIRNPLNAIRVIIQRLEREFKPESNEDEYKEFTAIIRKETDKINESIKHFLALAKPPVLHKFAVNLNDSLGEVLTLFQSRAKSKGCIIKSELGNLPPLNLDPELIQQAILNLLENSLAAVDSTGVIEVKTYQRDGKCMLEIADNGPGIPDEKKTRVFDIYYTTKPTGTGMGLPMVLRIIKEHNGRIELLDASSGGALFRMELPIE